MPVVLAEWILKSDLLPPVGEDLGPLFLILASVDPARVILGLHNEQTVLGDYDVVYLSRMVGCANKNVVEGMIDPDVQQETLGDSCPEFASPPLD